MSDLGELQKKQDEAASFALRMAEEKDPERLKAETRARVEKIVWELEKLESPELADTIAELRRGIL